MRELSSLLTSPTPTMRMFTVKVTSSTFDNTPVGTVVPLVVTDNGQSGVGNDTISWMGIDLGPLTGGNIQVQFNG